MLLQRFHITTLLQTLLVLLSLTSCVNDEFSDDIGRSTSDGMSCYLAFQFKFDSSSSATRAVFDEGDDAESEIGPSGNIVILFDDKDQLLGIYDLTNKGDKETDDDKNVKYSYVIRLEPEDDLDQLGSVSCLVVLNPNSEILARLKAYAEDEEKHTINDILKEVWKDTATPEHIGFSASDHKYFTMTNSVYYDDNGDLHVAEKFKPADYIRSTVAEAKREPITVYVERMVAKFSLEESVGNGTYAKKVEGQEHTYNFENKIVYCTFDPETGEPTYTEIPYQIRLTGWGVNAVETESYLFKKIQKNKNYFTDWETSKHRTLWSEDPHYDTDGKSVLKYPWQYRLAINSSLDYYGEKYPALGGANTNYLKNYSFTELNDPFSKDRIVYAPENTYDPTIGYCENTSDYYLDERTNLLAGTHLIVGAELLTNIDGEGFKANNLYRDRKGVYYKDAKDCFWGLVRTFNYSLQSQMLMKFDYYKWDNEIKKGTSERTPKMALTIYGEYELYEGTPEAWDAAVKEKQDDDTKEWPETTSTKGGEYALHHKEDEKNRVTYKYILEKLSDDVFIDGIIKDGDGKVLPWIDDLRIMTDDEAHNWLKLYTKAEIRYSYQDVKGEENEEEKKEGGKRVVVGTNPQPADENDRKSLMLEWMGAVDYFKDGKMYYSVPVLHNEKNEDAPDMKVLGDYGVVRNSWYKFKLTDIKGIGTSVYKIDDPIVPNIVKTNDQLNVTVDIIPWHKFDEIIVPVL